MRIPLFSFTYRVFAFFSILILSCFLGHAQPLQQKKRFTRQDSLRGSITPERAWWNVTSYTIQITPNYNSKTLTGWNEIHFDVPEEIQNRKMQIDLQYPMVIDSIRFQNKRIRKFSRIGNVYLLDFGNQLFLPTEKKSEKDGGAVPYSIKIFFRGKPREAINPPWDGGWIWAKDAKGRPWMSVACQGLGASSWYPCKDHQGDEPDYGAQIRVVVPETLVAVANGKLYAKEILKKGQVLYSWNVVNPINNYNIVPYIGKYVHFSDSFKGETGNALSLDYWVLDYNLVKAKKQFGRDVKPMLKAFEHWFGPFPFYEDGYKMVESPHLGMEHQSAIAYGNQYLDGYLGTDLSLSGWGLNWDYIIIHESAHEWFSNNITTNDIADMWIHEGFAMYAEALFIEYYYGKKAADQYVQGIRNNISNDLPVIGPYGVNQEGSRDMYNKGANVLHMIRQLIRDDDRFRDILRGLNKEFYHKTVNSADIESYFSRHSGKDLSRVFDQYLRTIKIPVLEYRIKGETLSYRWTNCNRGFDMPLRLENGTWLNPTTEWKNSPAYSLLKGSLILPDDNFFITVKKVM